MMPENSVHARAVWRSRPPDHLELSWDFSMATKRAVTGKVIVMAALVLQGTTRPVKADSETFSKHVVVAQEGHAAEAGRDILVRGGNAIDAAIATAFALAVTLPEAGNLGGGGFIVAYLADRKEVVTVDFREMAPGAASPKMYLGPDGKPRAVPRGCLGSRSAGDSAGIGARTRTVRQDRLGRAGAAGRPPGTKRFPDLGRAGRVAQSPAHPARTKRHRPSRAR